MPHRILEFPWISKVPSNPKLTLIVFLMYRDITKNINGLYQIKGIIVELGPLKSATQTKNGDSIVVHYDHRLGSSSDKKFSLLSSFSKPKKFHPTTLVSPG